MTAMAQCGRIIWPHRPEKVAICTKHTWTRFSCMECWKDGVKQYTYGTWNGDRCNLRKPMTVNELAKDIDRHRENVGY